MTWICCFQTVNANQDIVVIIDLSPGDYIPFHALLLAHYPRIAAVVAHVGDAAKAKKVIDNARSEQLGLKVVALASDDEKVAFEALNKIIGSRTELTVINLSEKNTIVRYIQHYSELDLNVIVSKDSSSDSALQKLFAEKRETMSILLSPHDLKTASGDFIQTKIEQMSDEHMAMTAMSAPTDPYAEKAYSLLKILSDPEPSTVSYAEENSHGFQKYLMKSFLPSKVHEWGIFAQNLVLIQHYIAWDAANKKSYVRQSVDGASHNLDIRSEYNDAAIKDSGLISHRISHEISDTKRSNELELNNHMQLLEIENGKPKTVLINSEPITGLMVASYALIVPERKAEYEQIKLKKKIAITKMSDMLFGSYLPK